MPEWSEDRLSAEERDALIVEHLPLLEDIVRRMCFDAHGALDRDDLHGLGMLGLIAAADSWEPERGIVFSTYAYSNIRSAILDELRSEACLSSGRYPLDAMLPAQSRRGGARV